MIGGLFVLLIVMSFGQVLPVDDGEQELSFLHGGYVSAEFGGSFSTDAALWVDHQFWDATPDGYSDTLGQAFLVGAGIGVMACDWLSCEATINFRGPFHYVKFQTMIHDTRATSTSKTRRFDFASTSYMVNTVINRAGLYSWQIGDAYRCNACVVPYAGVGIGYAVNETYNFHSVSDAIIDIGQLSLNQVTSIMTPFKEALFAWQAAAGVEICLFECLSLAVGYRYFDGGSFRSNNYIVDVAKQHELTGSIQVPAWKGHFSAHEIVITLSAVY